MVRRTCRLWRAARRSHRASGSGRFQGQIAQLIATLKEHNMNTVRLQSGVYRGVVALLLAATTACSGQQKAAPLSAAVATPSAADAGIPQTASPYDALPESVRDVMARPVTRHFARMGKRGAI